VRDPRDAEYAGGGPLGAGIASLTTPAAVQRSIDANQELRFQAASETGLRSRPHPG
jgi:hypothetical protein